MELEYPLDYTFKIVGLAADDLLEHARSLVAGLVAEAPGEAQIARRSAGGKYHSVAVRVTLRSEEERRAVYQALYADDRVLFYL